MFSYEVALDYWEIFLLILVRIASFVHTAPFFNTANTPQRVKLGLAFFISMIIFTIIPEKEIGKTSGNCSAALQFSAGIVWMGAVFLLQSYRCADLYWKYVWTWWKWTDRWDGALLFEK